MSFVRYVDVLCRDIVQPHSGNGARQAVRMAILNGLW